MTCVLSWSPIRTVGHHRRCETRQRVSRSSIRAEVNHIGRSISPLSATSCPSAPALEPPPTGAGPATGRERPAKLSLAGNELVKLSPGVNGCGGAATGRERFGGAVAGRERVGEAAAGQKRRWWSCRRPGTVRRSCYRPERSGGAVAGRERSAELSPGGNGLVDGAWFGAVRQLVLVRTRRVGGGGALARHALVVALCGQGGDSMRPRT